LFRDRLGPETKLEDLLSLLSDAHEYNELPVRHNEDLLNAELAKKCLLPVNPYTYDSSHTKAHLLFQSHFSRLSLPCADYVTDTKSVLDQAIRILQAMMDVAAEGGWLATTLRVQQLLQMVVQAMWIDDPAILMLPHFDSFILPVLRSSQEQLTFLPVLQKAFAMDCAKMCNLLATDFSPDQIQEVRQVISNLPVIDIAMSVRFGTTSVPLSIIPNCGPQETVWIDVPAEQECLLDVTFIRQSLFEVNPVAAGGARPKKSASSQSMGGGTGNNQSGRSNKTVYAPKFPKPKDEGWFLTLGSIEKQELQALKRVTLPRVKCSQQLSFTTPARFGRMMLTLYFMSDSYLGLDQQYNIYLNVCKSKPKEFDDDYETNNDF
jgi:activating signal cointegrator complex subunit 3